MGMSCAHCDKSWEPDPVFQVDCPSCEAEAGEKCRRPSGHLVWDPKWGALPKGAHPKRDIEALKQGVYGDCPRGTCPTSLAELPRDNPYHPASDNTDSTPANDRSQPTLFDT